MVNTQGMGLRIETGVERTTIVLDILNIIQKVRDTGIHLKVRVDEERWRIARGNKRQAGGSGPIAHFLSRLRRTDAPYT